MQELKNSFDKTSIKSQSGHMAGAGPALMIEHGPLFMLSNCANITMPLFLFFVLFFYPLFVISNSKLKEFWEFLYYHL